MHTHSNTSGVENDRIVSFNTACMSSQVDSLLGCRAGHVQGMKETRNARLFKDRVAGKVRIIELQPLCRSEMRTLLAVVYSTRRNVPSLTHTCTSDLHESSNSQTGTAVSYSNRRSQPQYPRVRTRCSIGTLKSRWFTGAHIKVI